MQIIEIDTWKFFKFQYWHSSFRLSRALAKSKVCPILKKIKEETKAIVKCRL